MHFWCRRSIVERWRLYIHDVAENAYRADFVMLGGMLHDEGGGKITNKHTHNGDAHKLEDGTYVPTLRKDILYSFTE